MSDRVQTRMTAEEFLQLPETTQPVELIAGELMMAPSPIANHQRIAGKIYALLLTLSPPGEPLIAPMDVYLDEENVFQPDVFWRAADSQCEERDSYFDGAPELVVEVHLPSTTKTDKQTKFIAYETHGVLEYWMADPVGQILEVWQRQNDTFRRAGVYGEGDTFTSAALGQSVTLSGIFPADENVDKNQPPS
jgi:Uma2 family endonuclease